MVWTLQNIVPKTSPTSRSARISAVQPLASKADCAAEATSREVRSSGRRFLLPRYFCASKPLTSPPSGQPRPAVSKSSIGRTPLRPSHSAACNAAGVSPSDETTPAPVMTTLFISHTSHFLRTSEALLPPNAYALFIATETMCSRARFGT